MGELSEQNKKQELAFSELSYWYMEACNFVSDYVFSHGFCLSLPSAIRALLICDSSVGFE